MDFEKLLEQEARKAARQDYEEVTEKTKDYSYKYSKAFIQKMNAMIHEEKRKAKKKRRWHILLVAAIILILNAGIVLANDDLREKVGELIIQFFDDTFREGNSVCTFIDAACKCIQRTVIDDIDFRHLHALRHT